VVRLQGLSFLWGLLPIGQLWAAHLVCRPVDVYDLLKVKSMPLRTPDEMKQKSKSKRWDGPQDSERALHVLLIEDDGNDQALFTFAASRSGLNLSLHTVHTVKEGISFLQNAVAQPVSESGPVDLVLLDLVMPGDSGFDFLRWWAGSRWRSIPVAVLSGSTYAVEQSTAVEMGAVAFLAKPNTLDQWQQTLKEVWGLASIHRHATHYALLEPKNHLLPISAATNPRAMQ
jgi:CheY-like chemotaxis protein